jgi:hypothetical protein
MNDRLVCISGQYDIVTGPGGAQNDRLQTQRGPAGKEKGAFGAAQRGGQGFRLMHQIGC